MAEAIESLEARLLQTVQRAQQGSRQAFNSMAPVLVSEPSDGTGATEGGPQYQPAQQQFDALWSEASQLRATSAQISEDLRTERETRGVGLASLRAELVGLREDIMAGMRSEVEDKLRSNAERCEKLIAQVREGQHARGAVGSELEEMVRELQNGEGRVEQQMATLREQVRGELAALQEQQMATLREQVRGELAALQETTQSHAWSLAEHREAVQSLRAQANVGQQALAALSAGQTATAAAAAAASVAQDGKQQQGTEGGASSSSSPTSRGVGGQVLAVPLAKEALALGQQLQEQMASEREAFAERISVLRQEFAAQLEGARATGEGNASSSDTSGVCQVEAQLALLREELLMKLEHAEQRSDTQHRKNEAVFDSTTAFVQGITEALETERRTRMDGLFELRSSLSEAIQRLQTRVEEQAQATPGGGGDGQQTWRTQDGQDESFLLSELNALRRELTSVDARHGEEFHKCFELCESIAVRMADLQQEVKAERAARFAGHAELRAEVFGKFGQVESHGAEQQEAAARAAAEAAAAGAAALGGLREELAGRIEALERGGEAEAEAAAQQVRALRGEVAGMVREADFASRLEALSSALRDEVKAHTEAQELREQAHCRDLLAELQQATLKLQSQILTSVEDVTGGSCAGDVSELRAELRREVKDLEARMAANLERAASEPQQAAGGSREAKEAIAEFRSQLDGEMKDLEARTDAKREWLSSELRQAIESAIPHLKGGGSAEEVAELRREVLQAQEAANLALSTCGELSRELPEIRQGGECAKLDLDSRVTELTAKVFEATLARAEIQEEVRLVAAQAAARHGEVAAELRQELEKAVVEVNGRHDDLRSELQQAIDRVESQIPMAEGAFEGVHTELQQEASAGAERLEACRRELAEEICKVEARLLAKLEEEADGKAAVPATPAVAAALAPEERAALREEISDGISEVEKKLLKRHENLVVTLNKDLGHLELRLGRELGDLAAQVGGGSPATAAAGTASTAGSSVVEGVSTAPEASAAVGPSSGGASADEVEELRRKMEEQQEAQTVNLQELGELVLGELAVVRTDSANQIQALKDDLRIESKIREEENCQLGEGLVSLADQLQLLMDGPVQLACAERWSPKNQRGADLDLASAATDPATEVAEVSEQNSPPLPTTAA